MTTKLHIVIHSLGMPFNERTIAERSLGGSESAAYYQARELAKRGHQVDVWTTIDEPSRDELGIRYTPVGAVTQAAPLGERFTMWASVTPHDVLIIQRHPLAFHRKWAASLCFWQLHDLALHRFTGAAYEGLWQVGAVTTVSEWHRQQVLDVYGLKPEAVHVVPNGVDPELYSNYLPVNAQVESLDAELCGIMIDLVTDDKFVMLYQSRPERGLEHLVRPGGIMERLKGTRAHLLICGYANTVPGMVERYAQLEAWGKSLPNVTYLGALAKPQLATLQQACGLLVYPTEFEEVSCITAMEAMHAGLPMITTDAGALKETTHLTGTRIVPLRDGKVDEDEFVAAIKVFADKASGLGDIQLKDMRRAQAQAALSKTWEAAVDQLERLIEGLYADTRANPARLVRYGFEHADLEIAEYGYLQGKHAPHVTSELALYDFVSSDAAYAAHYAKHQGAYYDDHEQQVIGEDVTHTQRFRGVMSYVAQYQQKRGNGPDGRPLPLRMLDFGCAHGHYLLRFAGWLPDSEFFGVDISGRAIAAAVKWAMRDKLCNVTLAEGGLDKVEEWSAPRYESIDGKTIIRDRLERSEQLVEVDQRFDVIIAGEVLEHVPDPLVVMQKLLNALKPGGVLIGTTPVGRWEWLGRKAHREAREHLWHFTRRDLDAIFEDYVHDVTYAQSGTDPSGALIGSYVFSVEQHALARVRKVDLEDRLASLAPRETISAVMIAKDAAETLAKCVKSFIDYVDEVVIAIDPATTDATMEVAFKLASEFRLTKFEIVQGLRATEVGFAAARNRALAEATGDWVLWLDADEEVQNAPQLWNYARASAIDGVALPQIHYSCDPPEVLTTDFPTRLFRRGKATFFGYVHEHPEASPGAAIPHTVIRRDVRFLHNGYVDEAVRRQRFVRNTPLLERDRKENPDRKLNGFLWLRDLVQGVYFELETTGGHLTDARSAQLDEAIALFEKLLDESPHLKLLTDALEFYSKACAFKGIGFEAKLSLHVNKPGVEQLSSNSEVVGRFHNRATFHKFITRITEESTKHYESKYL